MKKTIKYILNKILILVLVLMLGVCVSFGYKLYYFNAMVQNFSGVNIAPTPVQPSLDCYLSNNEACKTKQKDMSDYLHLVQVNHDDTIADLSNITNCMPRIKESGVLLTDKALEIYLNDDKCINYKTSTGDMVYLGAIKGILLNLDSGQFETNQEKIKARFNQSLINIEQNRINEIKQFTQFRDLLKEYMPDMFTNDYINKFENTIEQRQYKNEVSILQIVYAINSKENFLHFQEIDKKYHEKIYENVKFDCSDVDLITNGLINIDSIDGNQCVLKALVKKDEKK